MLNTFVVVFKLLKTSINFNQVKIIKAKSQKDDSEKEIKIPKFRDFLPIFALTLIVYM